MAISHYTIKKLIHENSFQTCTCEPCCWEIWFLFCFFVVFRFYQNLQSALPAEKLQKLQIPDPPISQDLQDSPHKLGTESGEQADEKKGKNKTSVYQRRRKREKHHQTDCCNGDGSGSVSELDDCLDLFTWSSGSANMLLSSLTGQRCRSFVDVLVLMMYFVWERRSV